MYCRECGTEVSGDARFCGHCGAALAPPGMLMPLPQPEPVEDETPLPEPPRRRPIGVMVVAALLVVVMLAGLTVGISTLLKPSGGPETGSHPDGGNINNYGLMATDGQYIFYYDVGADAILCARPDGSEQEMVYPGPAQFLAYAEGGLFMVVQGGELIRVSRNGGDVMLLASAAEFVNLAGGYLYYANPSDDNNIYRVSQNGGRETLVLAHNAYYLTTDGQYLYYQRDEDDESVYRCDMDGGNPQKLADGPMYYPFLVGDWLVFTDCETAIFRVTSDGGLSPDGGVPYVVTEAVQPVSLNAWQDWVIFIDGDGNLRRIKVNGTQAEQLAELKMGTPLLVIDDFLYYYASDGLSIMRMDMQTLGSDLFVGSGAASL